MDFQEFSQQNQPQKSTSEIISHAFETYKGVFLYAIVAMVLYFVASMLIQPISGFDSRAFSEEITSADGDFTSIDIWSIPGMKLYYGLSGLLGLVLAPLYVGVIYVANKYNFKQPVNFSDLFIGYKQNFLNIVIYSLISSIIFTVAFMMCLLPGLLVMPFLMLGYPILLFENASFADALSKSFNIAKENYGTFLGVSLLSLLISISGILLCGIGIIATMPFFLVAMYSIYCAFLGRPRQIEFKN